jgi:subtilisin family serine protease
VYEPYRGSGGNVTQGTWQSWDAKAGLWWGTRTSVPRNGALIANPCVQATPCTWAQLLATFPNVGVHATLGAVVLKAGSGWAGFRGNVDKLVIGVDSVTTSYDFELTPVRAGVPTSAPRGASHDVVASAHAPENILINAASVSGRVTRHTLFVRFSDVASQAQKDSALTMVDAEVIGGMYFGNAGFYYLRLRHAVASPPDSTSGPLLRAERTLRAFPFVKTVLYDRVDSLITTMFRRPVDGPGFTSWRLNSDSADGDNWHLEAIGAPFAWGCSIGGTGISAAVVDRGFVVAPDLLPNIGQIHEYSSHAAIPHGTWVASLLAAKGDNGKGITGLAYANKVNLYDADAPDSTVPNATYLTVANIGRAARSERIVNVSLARPQPTSPTVADSASARQIGDALAAAIGGTQALVILAAGNDGTDAQYGGYALAIDSDTSLQTHVLLVGGTQLGPNGQVFLDRTVNGTRVRTNGGARVQIAAPGEVVTIGLNDALTRAAGTSMAAPLVTGAAALLLDFDPSLSSAELQSLLIQGAVNGARSIADPTLSTHRIPILNAYESLKLAASRRGAPLCGNRIWNDGNNNIVVERTSTMRETIISRNITDYAAYVNPYHGGKRVDIGFSYEYDWDPSARAFREVPYRRDSTALEGGAWLGYTYVSDHDRTMWAQRLDTEDGTGQQSHVRLFRNNTLQPADTSQLVNDLGSLHIRGTSPSPPDSTCLMTYPLDVGLGAQAILPTSQFSGLWQCQGMGAVGSWDSSPETSPTYGLVNETPIIATPAPQGDAVYVPVSVRHISRQYSSLDQLCNLADTSGQDQRIGSGGLTVRRCALRTVDVDSAVRAEVYRIDVKAGGWTPLILDDLTGATELEGREINSLEVSEDGKEIMISTTRRVAHSEDDLALACHDETLEWISIDRSATPTHAPGHVNLRIPVPQGAACGGWVEAGGTVSPSRGVADPARFTAPPSSQSHQSGGGKAPARYIPLRVQRARLARLHTE